MGLDAWLVDVASGSQHPALDVAAGISYWLGTPLSYAALVLFLWWRRHRDLALVLAVAIALSDVAVFGIKYAFLRPRPDSAVVVTFLDLQSSFPSGHASRAFALVGALLLAGAQRRWLVAALAFAVLTGFFRLYLAAHFPSDLVAGALLGLGVACLARRVAPQVAARLFTRAPA